jgi:hypothetical protein
MLFCWLEKGDPTLFRPGLAQITCRFWSVVRVRRAALGSDKTIRCETPPTTIRTTDRPAHGRSGRCRAFRIPGLQFFDRSEPAKPRPLKQARSKGWLRKGPSQTPRTFGGLRSVIFNQLPANWARRANVAAISVSRLPIPRGLKSATLPKGINHAPHPAQRIHRA